MKSIVAETFNKVDQTLRAIHKCRSAPLIASILLICTGSSESVAWNCKIILRYFI